MREPGRISSRDPLSARRCTLKRSYGLAFEEFQSVRVFQKESCAICLRPLDRPNVDHSHTTGETRGLLCWHCNNALGKFRDNPEMLIRAADYLRNTPVSQALGAPRFGLPGRITSTMKRRRMLAKKALEANLVPANAYDFCCPQLANELQNMQSQRRTRKKRKEQKSVPPLAHQIPS